MTAPYKLGTDEAEEAIYQAICAANIRTQDALYRALSWQRIILYRSAYGPVVQAKPGDAGWTLPAAPYAQVMATTMVAQRTGVHLIAPIPECIDAECRIELRPRSSALTRYGVLMPVGTIDLGYRGELVATGMSRSFGWLEGHASLVQLVLTPGWRLVECNITGDETDRGDGGFGSTDGGA